MSELTSFNPPCRVCPRCGVSRPINVLALGITGRTTCVRRDHCDALKATTPHSKPAENSGGTAEKTQ